MESTSQKSTRFIDTFLHHHPQLKKQLSLFADQLKKKPQWVLSGVVAIFLLVGVAAAVNLVGVEQDIRQQAYTQTYKEGVVAGRSCVGVPSTAIGCDASNNKFECENGVWSRTDEQCNAVSKADILKPTKDSKIDPDIGQTGDESGQNLRDLVSRDQEEPAITAFQRRQVDKDEEEERSELANLQRADNPQLYDCVKTGAPIADCRNLIERNPTLAIDGDLLAGCILSRPTTDCNIINGLNQIPVYSTCDEIGACVQGRTCIETDNGKLRNAGSSCSTTSTSISSSTVIYDCSRAGVSAADCHQLLDKNRQSALTGSELANCILNPTGNVCRSLQGLESIATTYSDCSKVNECVDGRTCVYSGGTVLRNIGAHCGVRAEVAVARTTVGSAIAEVGSRISSTQPVSQLTPDRAAIGEATVTVSSTGPRAGSQVATEAVSDAIDPSQTVSPPGSRTSPSTSCSPTKSWLSKAGEVDAPCCGGGNQECASGICNADVGKIGTCAAVPAGAVASLGATEASTGLTSEASTDCSKANGLVQGTSSSGFVLKCDFDGNGSFGYHQPTGFIYGKEAAAACKLLCADPKTDVEKAARDRYIANQGSAGSSGTGGTRSSNNISDEELGMDDLACAPPMFASQFACVAFHDAPCLKSTTTEGCFQEAGRAEREKLCNDPYQQSESNCAVAKGTSCARHPKTGCFEPKDDVFAANQEYAEEIAAAEAEIKVTVTVTRNVFQQFVGNVQATIGSLQENWNDFWTRIRTGNTTEAPAPTTETTSTEPAEDSPLVDNSQLLDRGQGINDDDVVMNDGHMQVEAFCPSINPNWTTALADNRSTHVCKDQTGAVVRVFGSNEYTTICHRTYTDASIARQVGTGPTPAYNWRCVEYGLNQ